MTAWLYNAKLVEKVYGSYVDWEERFYECPGCGEPVYDDDWSDFELMDCLCPICGHLEENEE